MTSTPDWELKQSGKSEPIPPTVSTVRASAMRILGRREQSRQQLKQKLERRFGDSSCIEEVLNDLEESGLQSDTRFCEIFIRSRISRGQGEQRIRHELKKAGVDAALIDDHLSKESVEWEEEALRVACSKLGQRLLDWPMKQKLSRFLMQRGFGSDIVRRVIRRLEEEKQ